MTIQPPGSSSTMDFRGCPISLVAADDDLPPLPHPDEPFHVVMKVPFSLVVPDFNPRLARTEPPPGDTWRSWATRFFRRRREMTVSPRYKAVTRAMPHLHQIWWNVSGLIFGEEDRRQYEVGGSDADESNWESIPGSNVFSIYSTGVTEKGEERVLVLEASRSLTQEGGIRFTWEEMGEEKKAAWKEIMAEIPLYTPDPGETWTDEEMLRKNMGLCRLLEGRLNDF